MPLYKIDNPIDKAGISLGQASQTLSSMTKNQKTEYEPPSKSIGGGLMNAMGGMGTGATIGMLTGAKAATATTAATAGALGLGLGAWTGIGLGVGLLSYFLS